MIVLGDYSHRLWAIQEFCSPLNVRELIQYFIISDEKMSEKEQKQTVAELVRTMLDLVGIDPTIDQKQEQTSQLLLIILDAVKFDKLDHDRIVKLIERVNFTIFKHCGHAS